MPEEKKDEFVELELTNIGEAPHELRNSVGKLHLIMPKTTEKVKVSKVLADRLKEWSENGSTLKIGKVDPEKALAEDRKKAEEDAKQKADEENKAAAEAAKAQADAAAKIAADKAKAAAEAAKQFSGSQQPAPTPQKS